MKKEETVTGSITCFIIVDFFNTLQEKVSHLGEKYLSKNVGLYLPENENIVSFALKKAKGKRKNYSVFSVIRVL